MKLFNFSLIALTIVIVCAGCDSPPPDRTPSARIDASTLFSEYSNNEVAADSKYKGKYVAVTGIVEDIGKDLASTIYITLDANSWPLTVQCLFDDKHASSVAYISKGRTVTIVGKVDGKFGNVMVKDCTIQ